MQVSGDHELTIHFEAIRIPPWLVINSIELLRFYKLSPFEDAIL
jgi:hypothetical protein